jgi:hypothetical protein
LITLSEHFFVSGEVLLILSTIADIHSICFGNKHWLLDFLFGLGELFFGFLGNLIKKTENTSSENGPHGN